MTKRYFGTDGIRGRVGEEPITAEFMLRLGQALGHVLGAAQGAADRRPSVVIGKDTRVSGYMFEAALEAGLVSAGTNVQMLGPMPTPAVAWLVRELGADAGIVISASHNPYYDNGIKFFSAVGEKLSDEVELAIEAALRLPLGTLSSEKLGKAVRVDDAPARYLDYCARSAPGLSLRGQRIVLDCAHGATYHVAPRLFAELGAEVVTIGVQPDGFNINDGCGSTHLGALVRAVPEHRADLGIAFDGDGDRVLMVDAQGRVVDGDDIIYLLAKDLIAQGQLRGPVVGTLMTNYGTELALQKLGAGFLRANVGDRYVLQMLRENGGVLGGEASGHVLNLDRSGTGDGILNALFVFEALRRLNMPLADVRAELHRFPQVLLNVRAAGGAALVAHADVQRALAEAQRILHGRGRVVLRPSGTEPLVRVTVEGENADEVRRLAQGLADTVESAASARQ
ncbi:MAG: phosphoglucosamine mutase [Rudaea sp.]|uniref:phosphoglucosamine mutase n=1 Tax=Rudaea sp. TaxID=2136325 RepID=UPI0039E31DDF